MNDLPNEIICHIFSYLFSDINTLYNTCVLFRQIISYMTYDIIFVPNNKQELINKITKTRILHVDLSKISKEIDDNDIHLFKSCLSINFYNCNINNYYHLNKDTIVNTSNKNFYHTPIKISDIENLNQSINPIVPLNNKMSYLYNFDKMITVTNLVSMIILTQIYHI